MTEGTTMTAEREAIVRDVWASHAARMREKATQPSQSDIIQTALVKDRLEAIRADHLKESTHE